MLKTNYCVPDEKYSRKHVQIINFCVFKFWRGEKKKNTAYAALTYDVIFLQTANVQKSQWRDSAMEQ